MATTIYFPSIKAQATIDADIKRGGTASVCHAHNGEAYIGKTSRVKFTTVEPKTRDWKESDIDVLKHIPAGGFCYEIIQ